MFDGYIPPFFQISGLLSRCGPLYCSPSEILPAPVVGFRLEF
jgi:hypothetical protein